MSIVLILWGFVAALYGLSVLILAQSAVHEILVGVALLIATVSIGLGCVVIAIQQGHGKSTPTDAKNKDVEPVGLRSLFHGRLGQTEEPHNDDRDDPRAARERDKAEKMLARVKSFGF